MEKVTLICAPLHTALLTLQVSYICCQSQLQLQQSLVQAHRDLSHQYKGCREAFFSSRAMSDSTRTSSEVWFPRRSASILSWTSREIVNVIFCSTACIILIDYMVQKIMVFFPWKLLHTNICLRVKGEVIMIGKIEEFLNLLRC